MIINIKKIIKKGLRKFAFFCHHIKGLLDHVSMPKFANHPINLAIQTPREIINPDRIFLGDNVRLGTNCTLKALSKYPSCWQAHPQNKHKEEILSSKIVIGNRVTSTGSLSICSAKSVTIEDDVMFATNVLIIDNSHGYENGETPYKYQGLSHIYPIKIKEGAWIGQNVVILSGVTIGAHSIIGANSVVTKDIPDKCIAVGAPARIIKKWDSSSDQWIPLPNKYEHNQLEKSQHC